MGKLTMVAAGAAGYVLGARAGRERYDQIVHLAGNLWGDPRVQQRKDQAADAAKEAATTAAHRASDTVQQAAGAAGEKIQDARGSERGTSSADPLDRPHDPVPDPAASASPQRPESFPTDPGQPGAS